MNVQPADNIRDVSDLLALPPYSLADAEKNGALLGILKTQLYHAVQNNPAIHAMFSKLGIDIDSLATLEDIPPIPVQMFKYFDLGTCNQDQMVKILHSSGTTSGITSRIPLNKSTTLNQIKALKSILAEYLGKKRRLFIVIDHEGINAPLAEFSARTAGVRGLGMYATKTIYLLKEVDGRLVLNTEAIEELRTTHRDADAYVFGFTYIIWSVFYPLIRDQKSCFSFRDLKIFHSGGWKKLTAERVSKEEFSEKIAQVFNTNPANVLDFYGMAEQTGIIFIDCECGHKHVPVFSQVIIRDPYTQKPCPVGTPGIIEILSVLSDSYYSQAILTEDTGYLAGTDDCPCGRKGRYFHFASRIEKAEIRGCGDTFREQKQ
jgi:phenylacetate-coenzyme A ligase PaaK-like adenylate-forming protein